VAFVAAPAPASLTEEQFRQQALTQTWAVGAHYLVDTIVAKRAAHPSQAASAPALDTYTAQVWDLSQSSSAKRLGHFCFSAEAETPEACLLALAAKLRELEAAAYDADPTRRGEQMSDMYQELGAYDYAA
jgi:hypothetical protein